MSLPDWIPTEAWAGYIEMRKRQKKTPTDRAIELAIAKLGRLKIEGQDIGAVLDQSTSNGWTDLYAVRHDDRRTDERRAGGIQALGKKGQATADNAQAWLAGDQSQESVKEAKKRFASLFSGLADYYNAEVSKASLGLYWEGLRQYDYEAIEKACWAHTQLSDEAGRWMPKISDLNKMLAGRTSDQGQIAWSKVDRAVRTIGPYWDVAFDDPIIHRVISDMGGWIQMNSSEDKNWPFVAKEFVTRYQSFKMTGETPEHPRYLVGMANAQNTHSGHQQGLNVRLLGNVEKAKQIASGKTSELLANAVAAKQLG